ncbi:MAG TPA: hypothetical protein EYG82_04920 [Sulfurovum sp.]|nr:hypothetical protein [Sulfurovum sp.]
MKIIKLLLLLTFGLWADFKLDIPNDVNVSKLENIVKNGWDDSNVTLNNWIISNAERVMPEILEKIKKPILKVEPTNDNLFSTPKLLLGKDDILLIVAYTKYLEKYNKQEESMKINVEILKGLNTAEDKYMLSIIIRIVFEGIVVDGIEQYIHSSDITKLKNRKSYENINMLLTQTSEGFFVAMKEEQGFFPKVSKLIEKGGTKKDCKDAFETMELEEVGGDCNDLMKDVAKKLTLYNDNLYKRMFIAMKKATPEAMKSFEDKIKLERKQLMGVVSNVKFFVSGVLVKIKSLLGIEIKDFGYVSERMACQLFYVATPKINQTYLDYLQHKKSINPSSTLHHPSKTAS